MSSEVPGLHVMFGGTYDPIHNGHLRVAVELRETLEAQLSGTAHVHLVPCHIPPHRSNPGASARQRCEMLALAIDDEVRLEVDPREIERPEPSWSVETLAQMREEIGRDASLAMTVGTDSFMAIDRWHRWPEILELAHIIVVQRPGYRVGPGTEADHLLSTRHAERAGALTENRAGRILPLTLSLLDISATDIRARVASGRSPRYLVPDAVWRYICDHSLYTKQ